MMVRILTSVQGWPGEGATTRGRPERINNRLLLERTGEGGGGGGGGRQPSGLDNPDLKKEKPSKKFLQTSSEEVAGSGALIILFIV